MASSAGSVQEGGRCPTGLPSCWWFVALSLRGLSSLLIGQSHKETRQFLFIRGRNTPGRFVALLKNDWAGNGYSLDYMETHPLISYFRITEGLIASPIPARGVIWDQESKLHICIGKEYWQKRDLTLVHCFLLLLPCGVHFQGTGYISLQLNLTEGDGDEESILGRGAASQLPGGPTAERRAKLAMEGAHRGLQGNRH